LDEDEGGIDKEGTEVEEQEGKRAPGTPKGPMGDPERKGEPKGLLLPILFPIPLLLPEPSLERLCVSVSSPSPLFSSHIIIMAGEGSKARGKEES